MIPKLTANGYSLMIRALDGEGLKFSKIKIGNGEMPEDYLLLEDLQNPLIEVGIEEITKLEKYVKLKATMSNKDYDSGFDWTEAGIYVVDPDGGEEDILYAYSHYQISGDEKPLRVPAFNSNLVEIIHYFHVFIGELDNVTAILAESSEYAKKADLASHVDNQNNPHNVTKDQVGLGKVANVTAENQTPKFSATLLQPVVTSSTNSTTGIVTQRWTLSNIVSGEKLGAMLQKIRSAIAVLINHLSGSNPHAITPAQIGAAKTTHTHSATDINKGTLGIARGGTNAATAFGARTNLGIRAGQFSVEIVAGTLKFVDISYSVEAENVAYVVLTPMMGASNDLQFGVYAIAKTGFSAAVYSETYSGRVSINWVAVG